MSFIRSLLVALWLAAVPGWAQQPVVLVFGDSLSAGYGLPQGRGWVDLLQKRLAAEPPGYRVVNASISGETTLGGRNRLAGALREHKPRIVILALGANDALRGQSVASMQENLTAMVQQSTRAGAKVLLVGMRIPPNYGPDYTRKFHELFAQVARAQRTALVPFLLEGFAERRELFQADGIHPTVQAQPLILDTVWAELEPLLDRGAKEG
jgi:acyl-CoA thioesterase-1